MELKLIETIGNANLSAVAHGAVNAVFFEEVPIGGADQVDSAYANRFYLRTKFLEAKGSHRPGAYAMVDIAFEGKRLLLFEVKGGQGPHGCSAKDHFFEGGTSTGVEGHVGIRLVLGFDFLVFENRNEK
jgi:hypothetical protein